MNNIYDENTGKNYHAKSYKDITSKHIAMWVIY